MSDNQIALFTIVGSGGSGGASGGAVGASISNTYVAGQTVSAVRLVKKNNAGQLVYADKDSEYTVLGLSLTAGVSGANIDVMLFGEVQDGSFIWPIDTKLFLGLNGQVTATVPLTGWRVPIGYMTGINLLKIDIDSPTYRGT